MIIANIVSTDPEYRIHVQCMHIFSTLRCANFWLRAHILSFASTDESMVVYFEKRWVKGGSDIGGVHGPMFLWKAVRTHWIFQNIARKMYYWVNIYADLHRKNLAQSDKSNLRLGPGDNTVSRMLLSETVSSPIFLYRQYSCSRGFMPFFTNVPVNPLCSVCEKCWRSWTVDSHTTRCCQVNSALGHVRTLPAFCICLDEMAQNANVAVHKQIIC